MSSPRSLPIYELTTPSRPQPIVITAENIAELDFFSARTPQINQLAAYKATPRLRTASRTIDYVEELRIQRKQDDSLTSYNRDKAIIESALRKLSIYYTSETNPLRLQPRLASASL